MLGALGLPSMWRLEKGFVFELLKRSEANIPVKRNSLIKLRRWEFRSWVVNKSVLLGAEVLSWAVSGDDKFA